MPRVVGVDAALSKSGVGIITLRAVGAPIASGAALKHERPVGKPKRTKVGLPPAPTLAERRECFVAAAREVHHYAAGADLVVVYDVPTGVKTAGAARVDIPAAWWAIVGPLLRSGVPVATVLDGAARKALTGKGSHGDRSSNKVATALAVRGLYPDLELESDDVADAVAVAHLGAVALGWDVPTLARHRDVKWSEWPTFPDPAASEPAA